VLSVAEEETLTPRGEAAKQRLRQLLEARGALKHEAPEHVRADELIGPIDPVRSTWGEAVLARDTRARAGQVRAQASEDLLVRLPESEVSALAC